MTGTCSTPHHPLTHSPDFFFFQDENEEEEEDEEEDNEKKNEKKMKKQERERVNEPVVDHPLSLSSFYSSFMSSENSLFDPYCNEVTRSIFFCFLFFNFRNF